MCRRLWMIATVWAYRPMMWLVAIFAVSVLIASIVERNRTSMRSAFNIPGEYGATLKNGEELQRSAESGEVDMSVEGVDLTAMDLRDPANPLKDLSSLQQALANYPSVRWIRFGRDQIQHVSIDTLSKLSELATIIIHDDQVTQTDVDKLAQLSSLQMLVLETLDFPASLSTLSDLPGLDTLVLSHGTFNVVDSSMESLFRPEVLAQTHDLSHLRRLVLMPQWLPGEAYFAGRKTPDPACDPILKENAAKLLAGHPSLTDLWLGVAKYERSGKDLAAVQAAMPNVNVRSAQYNETSLTRVGVGSLAIVLLTWVSMSNLSGHFSTPQRRVIPNYEKPHIRFVFGFALLVIIVSTVAIHSPVAVGWLPAMIVSVLAVAFAATLIANMTFANQRRPAVVRVLLMMMMALFLFQWILIEPRIRPVLREAIPAMEPAMEHFLGGHHPVLAIVIAAVCFPAIYWMISQFTDHDRLNAEAGLPPTITGTDFAKQGEILILQNRGKAYERTLNAWETQLDAWHSRLEALKSKPGSWLRDIRLDWMGEPTTILSQGWIGYLVMATVFSILWRPLATVYVCATVAAALIIPLLTSLSRRDVLPLELLCPNSRAQFVRRRTLSTATKYAYLFAGLYVHVAIVQYFCFHTLNLENTMRAVITFAPITIAGTGLVLWGSSIRNIFALGLLVVMGLVIVTFASFSYLDFRWIEPGKTGEQIHEFVTSPLYYAVSYAVAGLLLWTGFNHLSRCELARE